MDGRSVRKREQYPDLGTVTRRGLDRLAIHVASGNRLRAYRAWRAIWQELATTQFSDSATEDERDDGVIPCADIFDPRVAGALEHLEIESLEDFDGWTLTELQEASQIGPKTVREINKILRAHGIWLKR